LKEYLDSVKNASVFTFLKTKSEFVFFRKDLEKKNVFRDSSGENPLGVTTIHRGNLGSSLMGNF
jgi:hypothetical protein